MTQFAHPSYSTVPFRLCPKREFLIRNTVTVIHDGDHGTRVGSITDSVAHRLPNGQWDFQSDSGYSGLNTTHSTVDLVDTKNHFLPLTRLRDAQPIRAADFHPSGKVYAVGSGRRGIQVCAYRTPDFVGESYLTRPAITLLKRPYHHRQSVYCLAWNPSGTLLATGSSDKTVKLMRFSLEPLFFDDGEIELTMHDGTVRDVCFLEDQFNRSNLLVSAGGGNFRIYVTDCKTGIPFHSFWGHAGHINSLYSWGGATFASGSQDKTVRLWDLRSRDCVDIIHGNQVYLGAGPGSPVTSVCVDPTGRLLAAGHEDGTCRLYDMRGRRTLQIYRPHLADIRSIRFSNQGYHLLTASYDHTVAMTDLHGELTEELPYNVVADHTDKVTCCRWHPNDYIFMTASADMTAVLWGLPAN